MSLSVSPSFCEIFADTAVANSGIATVSSVMLVGYVGDCSMSIRLYFAGGQKAIVEKLDSVVTRTIISPIVAPTLNVSQRVTADAPFIVSRKYDAVMCCCFLLIFQFQLRHRMTSTTPLSIPMPNYLFLHIHAL
jgi:hypothetical protein